MLNSRPVDTSPLVSTCLLSFQFCLLCSHAPFPILRRGFNDSVGVGMKLKLKRLEDQVMVITGGTSGIGLATAKRAAERGARVVLCSRNEPELAETVSAIEERGGTARSLLADVANPDDVERLAATAIG